MADVIYAISAGDSHNSSSDWKAFNGGFDAFKKEHRFLIGDIPEDSPPRQVNARDVQVETQVKVDGDEPWVLYPAINIKRRGITLRFFIRQSMLTN